MFGLPEGSENDFMALPPEEQRTVLSHFNSDFSGLPTAEQDKVLARISGNMPATAPTEKPESKGFLSSIGESLSNRAGNIVNEFSGMNFRNSPERALHIGGQVAGFANDVQGAALKSAYQNIVPQKAQDTISGGLQGVLNTKLGQMGMSALQSGKSAYEAFRNAYPDTAKDIEAVANIGMLYPTAKIGQVEKTIGKEGVNVAKDMATIVTTKSPETTDKAIGAVVKNGISKAIRPTVVGKATNAQASAYYTKAKDAVETVINNKNNLNLTNEAGDVVKGELPSNLNQFAQAIEQTKKGIFEQYDNLAKAAGEEGAKVDLTPIAQELQRVADDKALNKVSPKVAQYASDAAKRYSRDTFTASEAQDAIQHLNRSLDAYYKNPTHDHAGTAFIDAMVANKLRNSLDNAIENTTGPGYQELKNKYSSLKAVEADVNKRAIVDARKNVKGLIDFTDVFSGAEVLKGILTLNPTTVATGATAKAIAMLHRYKNNPNPMVKNLFRDAEALMQKRDSRGFKPQSYTGKTIKNTIQGASND